MLPSLDKYILFRFMMQFCQLFSTVDIIAEIILTQRENLYLDK